jgi:thiosulfate dehydrogenase
MHRVLTAARFIKARMPLGKPDLNDADAFDVAGFINAQPRPHMADLERDYPDRSAKPVDTSYGPYADPFPQAQHQFGPFQPIEAYYRARKKK